MYPAWSSPVFWGFVVVWLCFLSFLVWKQNKFLKSLFPKSGERDIRKKFEELVQAVGNFKGELSDLETKVAALKKQGVQHVQGVELFRFNPFEDTGGDQSFVVCLLNGEGTGVVISSLHTRSGTRIFGKEIILGKSAKHDLSKEEEQVIKKVMTKLNV